MAVTVHNQAQEKRQEPAGDSRPASDSRPGASDRSSGKRSWERDIEEAVSDPARDERNYDTGPKVDPRAPGASNNGDLGRRMYGGEFPSEPDRRTHRQKKDEWPTRGFRPGSEEMIQEAMPQGMEPRTEAEVDEDVALTKQSHDERRDEAGDADRSVNRPGAGASRDAASDGSRSPSYAGSQPASSPPAPNPGASASGSRSPEAEDKSDKPKS